MATDRKGASYGSDEYDRMYESNDATYENPTKSQYYPMFRKAAATIDERGIRAVLEVGCGSGVLAEMVIARDISYRGFDLSSVGVEKAKRRNHKGTFFVGDATAPESYAGRYDGILCCEVLEHIDRDLDAVRLWNAGTPVVCSVPNFDYYTHVRYFKSEEEIVKRYGDLIRIDKIERINKPLSAGKTWLQYLKSIRWKLQEGKTTEALGMLGFRRFDWNGGWFLFNGVRR